MAAVAAAKPGGYFCDSMFSASLASSAPRVRKSSDKGLILVVDDDFEVRASTADLLYEMNFWPVTARNGLEALELMQRGVAPVAMLVDLNMPLMNGEVFFAQCNRDPRLAKVPRILVSAARLSERRASVCQAEGFLHKPLQPRELDATLNRLLGKAA